jgi:4-hydroxy-tetrahydrodipicolinate reductase
MILDGHLQRGGTENNNMKRFEVLVVGRGKLANELMEGLNGDAISHTIRWDNRSTSVSDPRIVVHAGSGRELPEVINYCTNTNTLLFELSTADSMIPDIVNFPVIICPNVNLQMIRFMAMVRQASRYFKGQTIEITESHQATKKTKPGTAIYLANQLGVPESEIRSERNPERQQKIFDIPSEYLARHAYHKIAITSPDAEITLETRVLGKTAYATSLSEIIAMVSQMDLRSGLHDIVDLITE